YLEALSAAIKVPTDSILQIFSGGGYHFVIQLKDPIKSVEFFEKNDRDVVVIMQQPYYHSRNNDGFIEINENLVFFNFSNKDFVDVSKLNREPPGNVPDENSKMAGLGFSAPNWAYYINDNGLEKFELGQ
uniref:hypothetical protein n=1 Tax=uncultured Amphritea sp. TaxID=981605 RepID=UPI002620F95C